MPQFIIERELPNIGQSDSQALRLASAQTNAVLAAMNTEGKSIAWDHSYVAGDKTFCVYTAADEALIHEHAKRSGIPATHVTAVNTVIDPATAHGSA